ncbi:hypothetical protein NPIL_628281 [Nephila pilipes]|uniref:Uncharacterized protein n=1 Tax=Nephila pilipes TaxID=299642 RepID=A0A8X6PLP4_NEPPI|nr:hypothetical protein NPIL_628281 [Nephila pilipes]
MEYVSAYSFLGPMKRLQTDGTIVWRFKNIVGSVVPVKRIQYRLRQFDPRGHRLESKGFPCRTDQQVEFRFPIFCPNDLQKRSMPPFGRCLHGIVFKLPRLHVDKSVEIGYVQLVIIRQQLSHLFQDALAERNDGYNFRWLQAV